MGNDPEDNSSVSARLLRPYLLDDADAEALRKEYGAYSITNLANLLQAGLTGAKSAEKEKFVKDVLIPEAAKREALPDPQAERHHSDNTAAARKSSRLSMFAIGVSIVALLVAIFD
jgi:hypothetical protein